ncbi:MAG TPA: carbohydrate kinase family protein [Roseiflexaceae bacterium]|nr:carbohydrate kinase family protein [Roseiflexaceae bacterium]
MRVVTVGDLVADIVVAVPLLPLQIGQYQEAHAIRIEPGGAGNFLIAGARLGMQMISIGALGDDAFGHEVAAIFRAEGIDTALITHPPGTSTTAVIVLNDDHGHTIMTGMFSDGPEIDFLPEWAAALASADAIFAFGYSLREGRMRTAVLDSLEYGRSLGRPILFDPGPEFDQLAADVRKRVLASCDVILLTEAEVPLTGMAEAADLLQHGPQTVVVKRGEAGCRIISAAGVLDMPGFPVVARDTAGAGDCFAAAFIFGMLSNWQPPQIARFANAMGAAMVQKRGTGRQAPYPAEISAILGE